MVVVVVSERNRAYRKPRVRVTVWSRVPNSDTVPEPMTTRFGKPPVNLPPVSILKAAFITEFGLFEPLVMFFGLCNSPPTFQRLMDTTFHNFIIELWLLIYMDDHTVTSMTKTPLFIRN